MTPQQLSEAVEALLVERNLRHMAGLRAALAPGYLLRAAHLLDNAQRILIGTGFPVNNTFETDGPLGAIALYDALAHLGKEPVLACASPLADALDGDYRILRLTAFDPEQGKEDAARELAAGAYDLVLSIERPGLASDNCYYNMRGEDISPRCGVFDFFLTLASCPTIGIGDGGNEIGMGKVAEEVAALDIRGAATSCDELLVADVSNWAAYGLITVLGAHVGQPLLWRIRHRETLAYLSERGSVDGVTRENTLTEDGLAIETGEALLWRLSLLSNSWRRST